MKTQELSEALIAFAPLTEGSRATEIRHLANIFSGGKEETVVARLKQIPSGYGLPASVKVSLTAIEAGLKAVGAKKQATDVAAVLSKFNGQSAGTVEELAAQVKTAIVSRPVKASGAGKTVAPADQVLARQLADDLTRHVLDKSVFAGIVQRLDDAKKVSTPTLHLVGNQFLGNSKAYKGRKPVIDDIMKRHSEDISDKSRRAAVKRAG
ncbi:MAG: hypothetical protein ACLP7P_09575 [Rhodomicrobium sp.]